MKTITTFIFLLFSTVSIAQPPAQYYTPTNGKTGTELKVALHQIIKNHKEYPYTAKTTDVWDILKESDRDTVNPSNVILVYTGRSVDAAQEYASGKGWTREHTWAKSRGDFGTSKGAGTDLHALKPADVSVNSTRNNKLFNTGGEKVFDEGVFTGCYNDKTNYTFEPRDEVKGDVARMIFYMAVRYEGTGDEPDLELTENRLSKDSKEPLHGVASVLLKWHQEDPVDAFERNRNEVIFRYQGNRNPFIDNPEYVELIWGN